MQRVGWGESVEKGNESQQEQNGGGTIGWKGAEMVKVDELQYLVSTAQVREILW